MIVGLRGLQVPKRGGTRPLAAAMARIQAPLAPGALKVAPTCKQRTCLSQTKSGEQP